MLSDHNEINPDITAKKITIKLSSHLEIKQHSLKKVSKEIRKYLNLIFELNKMEIQHLWAAEKAVLREKL